MKRQNAGNAAVMLVIVFGTIVASLVIGALVIAPALDMKRNDGAFLGLIALFVAALITGAALQNQDQQDPASSKSAAAETPALTDTSTSSEDQDNNRPIN